VFPGGHFSFKVNECRDLFVGEGGVSALHDPEADSEKFHVGGVQVVVGEPWSAGAPLRGVEGFSSFFVDDVVCEVCDGGDPLAEHAEAALSVGAFLHHGVSFGKRFHFLNTGAPFIPFMASSQGEFVREFSKLSDAKEIQFAPLQRSMRRCEVCGGLWVIGASAPAHEHGSVQVSSLLCRIYEEGQSSAARPWETLRECFSETSRAQKYILVVDPGMAIFEADGPPPCSKRRAADRGDRVRQRDRAPSCGSNCETSEGRHVRRFRWQCSAGVAPARGFVYPVVGPHCRYRPRRVPRSFPGPRQRFRQYPNRAAVFERPLVQQVCLARAKGRAKGCAKGSAKGSSAGSTVAVRIAEAQGQAHDAVLLLRERRVPRPFGSRPLWDCGLDVEVGSGSFKGDRW